MSENELGSLIERLDAKAGAARHAARRELVALGSAAVPALVEALAASAHHTRWGAAKALGQIADPSAAPAFVTALEDDESDVRWLAAIGLVKLGDTGLMATLRGMISGDMELTHHHAAHHVLHDFADGGRDDVAPVLAALEGPAPDVAAPLAAGELLKRLAE